MEGGGLVGFVVWGEFFGGHVGDALAAVFGTGMNDVKRVFVLG